MNFQADFNALTPDQRKGAHDKLRQAFGRVLTEIEDWNGDMYFTIQLECVSTMAQKMLNQRVRISSYAADSMLLNHKLYMHEVEFVRGSATPETGVFHQLNFLDLELWKVASVLEKAAPGPCQMLRTDEAISKIIEIPEFRPHLPKKLQNLDLHLIEKRERSRPNPSSNLGRNAIDMQG